MKIEHLIFDLDNTLYTANSEMDFGITQRMMECVMNFFNCSFEEAAEIRKKKVRNFSTTLEWLRSEGLSDVEGFFRHVHPENEADELKEDPGLRPFLQSIEIPKIICTNAPREHAERVLKKLNVIDLFSEICDIRDFNLQGKPYPSAFKIALKKAGGTIENSIFIDDMLKYTDGWESLGGTAVLVGNKNGHHLNPDAAAKNKEKPQHPGRTLKIESIYKLPDILSLLRA